mmetsp:Transcript_24263/g.68841  ORF Transcript_24263/g.68841 Transcript_24263/m.68841 type:complete len:339 (+) Transcript_24263:90-1106(+)
MERAPTRRRLRSKGPGRQRQSAASVQGLLGRLLQLDELARLVSSWLDVPSLLRLGCADATGRALAAMPETWRGRSLDLRVKLRGSAQLQLLLRRFSERWAGVHTAVLPQVNLSASVAQLLKTCLPGLRSLDVCRCTRAGGLRLLGLGLPGVETLVAPGYLPTVPLPSLRVLELWGAADELHVEGVDEWAKLPALVPNLEVLRVPWNESEDDVLNEALWEKLHEPPLGCRTSDACLEHLRALPRLRELDLSEVYTVCDDGLRVLANLPKLERLALQNAGRSISSAGLRALALGSAPLRWLDLRRCCDVGRRPSLGRTSLRPEDVAAFRRARPEVEVLFS